ncbi:MAG TPA: EamA family transporter [Rhodobacteraceae bacterium]|nr:EamA family transporter [Paracoccaceae bacterium]
MLLLSFIWGSSFLTTTMLVETLAPLHVVTHRVLWAAVFLWIYALVRRLPVPRDLSTWGALLIMGAGANALPFVLQAYAQTTIESGLAGILNASTAIFGPLVAALVLSDERLTRAKATGVALGFAGVALVFGLDVLGGFDLRSAAQLAMIASTFCYAATSVFARLRLGHLSPEVAALGMLTGSSLIMLPLSWAVEGPLPFNLPAPMLAALAVYGLVITAIAYLLFYRIIRLAGAGNTTLVTLLVVPVAVTLGAMVRAESLPPSAYAGFGLIALGLVVIDGRLLGRR